MLPSPPSITSRFLVSTLTKRATQNQTLLSHANPHLLRKSTPTFQFIHTRNIQNLASKNSVPNVIAATATTKTPLWQKVAIGGTIALATSATLLNQLSKAPHLESQDSIGSNIVSDLKDENNRIGVEKKTTADLMLSMLVYKLCTFGLLVDIAPQLISLAETLHLTTPVYWVVRKTFFAQFCGGESADDCVGTMNSLRSSGINSILDLSIEADLEGLDIENQTPTEIRARFNKSADSTAQQIGACIETASRLSKSFAAIKITAMSSPLLLQQVTSVLLTLEKNFKNIDQDRDGKVTKEEFKQLVKMLPSPSLNKDQPIDAMIDQLFTQADHDQDGKVDWIDFASTVSLNRDETRSLFMGEAESAVPGLIKEDLEDYKRLLTRMETLCGQAQKTQTRLMIDAEQSYFQAAIDSVALHLMEQYNNTSHSEGPLIFNTYQMYLKDALGRLKQDYTRAQRNGYVLAAKLVRGAYMVSERRRAIELGLEDPICDGIEATHASYNGGVDFMLEKMIQRRQMLIENSESIEGESSASLSLKNSPVVLFVASHNKDSVIRTCERMSELDMTPHGGLVMFGQLMGMCDQISYTLGQYGYGIYKYVPYGPIHHVIPYLIRRAQENATVLGGVTIERRLLWDEFTSRFSVQKQRAQIQAVPAPIVPAGPTTTL
ncbi:hypothetical protein BGZ76_004793 [Entomortierella beljakovae]|nr:hypothetical protein BGZ76_004793 [Entomortierella beljakovae]